MNGRPRSSKRLRRRPRDLYKDELVAIVDRLVHVLHGVPDETGELPAEHTLSEAALADLHRALADYGLRRSPNPAIEFELDLLRQGDNEPLRDAAKAKIRAAYEWPCERTWHAAHVIPITSYGSTLWDFVRELDPTFPARKPSSDSGSQGGQRKRASWPRVPDSELVRQALIRAIATAPVLDGRDDPNRGGGGGGAAGLEFESDEDDE